MRSVLSFVFTLALFVTVAFGSFRLVSREMSIRKTNKETLGDQEYQVWMTTRARRLLILGAVGFVGVSTVLVVLLALTSLTSSPTK